MNFPREDKRRFGGSVPYGRPASWQRPPSDEEVQEILAKLTDESEIRITEREPRAGNESDDSISDVSHSRELLQKLR